MILDGLAGISNCVTSPVLLDGAEALDRLFQEESTGARQRREVGSAFINYRKALIRLAATLDEFFPMNRPVFVEGVKYRGYGCRVADTLCPPDYLAVLLENGNVWFYEPLTCTPVSWSQVPKQIRRAWLLRRNPKMIFA